MCTLPSFQASSSPIRIRFAVATEIPHSPWTSAFIICPWVFRRFLAQLSASLFVPLSHRYTASMIVSFMAYNMNLINTNRCLYPIEDIECCIVLLMTFMKNGFNLKLAKSWIHQVVAVIIPFITHFINHLCR